MAKKQQDAPKAEAEATPVEQEAPKASKKTEFHVHNSIGTFIRTYSVEIHGPKAGDLAAEYAGKIGGRVE